MFKGKAKIELFEGAKKVHEQQEKNMFTNALDMIVNNRVFGSLNQAMYQIQDGLCPLQSKGLGGILCFENVIEEDPNTVLPPLGNSITAHAGATYSGSSTKRGAYNSSESGLIENGFRNVWDFPTSAANGQISCISLTSRAGGDDGLWSDQYLSHYLKNDDFSASGQSGGWQAVYEQFNYPVTGTSSEYDNPQFFYASAPTNGKRTMFAISGYNTNQISLTKWVWKDWNTVDLRTKRTNTTNNAHIDSYEIIKTYGIGTSYISAYVYEDKIHVIARTSSTKCTHDIFSKAGGLISSKEITFDKSIGNYAAYYQNNYIADISGRTAKFDSAGNFIDYITDSGSIMSSFCYVNSQGLLCLSSSSYSSSYYYYDGSNYRSSNNYNLGQGKDRYLYIEDMPPLAEAYSYSRSSSSYYYYYYYYYAILSHYLATINNLSTPITKTSAQSMKITYEVTQG